jgi:hydroxymethylglutaryl-CoA reductase
MQRNSRWPGFYKLSIEERRKVAAEALGISQADLARALDGGLEPATADKIIENVVGTFSLPFALALNVKVNDIDYIVPMVVEEPSVVAAASNAAKMIREGGGFEAKADPPVMIAQVQLDEVSDAAAACDRVRRHEGELCAIGDACVPGLVKRGGGMRGLEPRDLGDGMLVVHLYVDCRDAMGANLVNTVAEGVAPRLLELCGGTLGLRILTNLCDQRCVRIKCRVPADALAGNGFSGEEVRDGIVRASRFAERDPYRATTHNKGLMNGLDAVVIATGNDWRAVESGAHAFAARSGAYRPLCVWKRDGDDLIGELEMPLSLGTVGGPSRVHDGARMGLRIISVGSATELAMVAASVGMASNLAALRALATEGIQRGHMALHARTVAMAAGASGSDVEEVAARIHELGTVTLEAAMRTLHELRLAAEAAVSIPITSSILPPPPPAE